MQDNILTLSDGRSLGYFVYGASEGVPIFLFHGTPGSRVLGLEDEQIVKTYNLRIIAPERPGYGLSSPQPNREIQHWPADVSGLSECSALSRCERVWWWSLCARLRFSDADADLLGLGVWISIG